MALIPSCKVCGKQVPHDNLAVNYSKWFVGIYPFIEGASHNIELCPECGERVRMYIDFLATAYTDPNVWPDELDTLAEDV